jgi:hypothetical protein
LAGVLGGAGLLAFGLVMGLLLWAASRPETQVLGATFTVYTDAILRTEGIPAECRRFGGLRVEITAGSNGPVLWRGRTQVFGATEIGRIERGCAVGFETEALPTVEGYVVEIATLGRHLYRLEAIQQRGNVLVWDSICLQAPDPCVRDKLEVNYDS